MRKADELNRSGDEVNANLLDLVVNRLLDRDLEMIGRSPPIAGVHADKRQGPSLSGGPRTAFRPSTVPGEAA